MSYCGVRSSWSAPVSGFDLTPLPPLTRLPAYRLRNHAAGSSAIWFSPLISK